MPDSDYFSITKMKITITKIIDRVRLLYLLRSHLVDEGLTFKQLIDRIDNLPYSITSDLDIKEIESILGEVAIFSIEKDYPEYVGDPRFCPPWQQPNYIAARKWYDSLPEEDKEKVKILIRGSGPWAG